MNPGAADPLAGLRDIHLPPPPGWWPPAPGWWLLASLLLVLIVLLARAWRRRRRRRAPLLAAGRELEAIRARYRDSGDGAAAAREVSVLLRRVALAARPAEQVAGLGGSRWLACLDRLGATDGFSAGPGRVLEEAAWSQRDIDATALLDLVEQTLSRLRRDAAAGAR